MLQPIKRMTIVLIIAALVVVPLGANALAGNYIDEDNNGEKMTGDLLLVRPLGIASTILGAAVFVVSLPFSALGGNVKEAGQKLVADPAKFTFKRPIGDFSSIDYGLTPHRYK